jgi:uncharacterized protein YkwD
MHRRFCTMALALLALALCAPAGAQAADCPGADDVPTADNLAAIGQSTLCLVNQQRAAHGLPALTENSQLTAASAGYSARMVQQAFFSHESPDGGMLVQRLTAAGYLHGGDDWVVGENIGWGQGPLSTPRAMVDAWMNSAGHRENILADDYRHIGLGLALGTPSDRSWGATYTTDFGRPASHVTLRSASSRRSTTTKRRPATRKSRKASARAACARAAHARGRSAKAAKRRAGKRTVRSTCARRAVI